MRVIVKTLNLTLWLAFAMICSFVFAPRAHAGNPAVEGPVCVANAGNSVSGYAYFIPSSINVGPNQTVNAILRTYACNGTPYIVENDFGAFGDSFVQETGQHGVVDFSQSGLPNVYGYWLADMGKINPGSYSYRDISVKINGSAFNNNGAYTIKLNGFGSVYYQQWQNGFEVGCGADGNPSTPTQRCVTNAAYASYTMNVTVPQPKAGAVITKYGPDVGIDVNGHPMGLWANPNTMPGNNNVCISPGGCSDYNGQHHNPFNLFSSTTALSSGNHQFGLTAPNSWRIKAERSGYWPGAYSDIGTGNNPTVNLQSGQTTYVDVYYEPDIQGNIDQACSKDANGNLTTRTVTGWAFDPTLPQDPNNPSKTPNQIDLYFDGPTGQGQAIRTTANLDRPDLPKNTNGKVGRYHGFSADIPAKYFDGQNHTVYAYPLENGQGIGSPPMQLNFSPKSFNCGSPGGSIDKACTPQSDPTIAGWAYDPYDPKSSIQVRIYYDGDGNNAKQVDTVNADQPRPDLIGRVPGILDPSYDNHGFSEKIPDKFVDGNPHKAFVYPLRNGQGIGSPPVHLDPYPIAFTCQAQLHPWLQTFNGDVIVNGRAIDQNVGLRGSRAINSSDKDTEYLIMAAVGGSGPFCSTANYILTNPQATTGNCQNGNGYRISSTGLGAMPNDKIIQAINRAWVANGSGNPAGSANTKCNPYNTVATNNIVAKLSTGFGANSCVNGTIIKYSNNHLSSIDVESGRITIWVASGDLASSGGTFTIDNNIIYSYLSSGYNDPHRIPNLAIIVEGNVSINGNITQIDAAIYATGKINTCSQYTATSATSTQQCTRQLVVHGMLASRDGFEFGRAFSENNNNPPAAEQVLLTGQTVAFPPPGFDNLYFGNFDNSTNINTGELPPRF